VILERSHGRGAARAFEVVGINATFKAALESVRKGGSLTLVGNISPNVELALQAVVTREISLFGSCASQGEYQACLEMIARGKIDVEALISAKAPLSQGADWFKRLYAREPGLMKVLLEP
jgi:threonine dehydrogenase-like Zn-dependent dehydrogenase